MFKTLNKLNITNLFLLAIFLRLLLMPFLYHPDIKTYNYQASFLKDGVINIYTYLINNKESLSIKEEFVYFPLTYFFLGGYQIIVNPLLGENFNMWLSDASAEVVSKTGTFRYLFILKLPYLILDLIIPFLLIKFFDDAKSKRKIFTLWLFNPFTLVIIYAFSNIDIIPLFFSTLSLLFLNNKRFVIAGLLLGLAASFKAYPLLFVPFFCLFIKSYKQMLKFFIFVILPLIFIITPFWSTEFVQSALISGLTTRITVPNIPIGFGESLMVGIISLFMLFLTGVIANKNINQSWYFIFASLLLLFSTIHYHIQWLLWIMPYILIFHISEKRLNVFVWIWISLALLIPLFYDDKSMTVSIFSSISLLYNLVPTPFLIVKHFYDPFLAQGVIHSLLFALAVIIIGRSLRIDQR